MKPVLIVENSNSSLTLNENTNTRKEYILGGIFTEFGVKNRNDRVYTAEKFIPCLDELNERINTIGVVYGEFDHPDVFDTSLSRSSHLIRKASFIREHNRVEGEIRLLSTYWGREAKSLVDDGCPLFVSSRAAGITENDGTVSLKKLFTYDIVADPGFASAKMSCINESLGFPLTKETNYRIYEMSDESKINDLFNMNKNEFVTKNQLGEYSKYLISEIAQTKKQVKEAVKAGNIDPKKFEKLLEYYDTLNETNNQIAKYLDYLAEKLQVVVNENKSLKTTTQKIIKHNDYLAENLEKSINYSEYLAENLDKNISYSEYLAENLDKNISYSEYLAENLDKNISYSEYLAENLDKNISYSEYIAENLDKNISYSEYLAENLDKNISYSEYIAENLDHNIAYSEYLAEHVQGNIAYSEYIAENLDDNIAYSEYLAENLDKSISYSGLISEKLNGNKLNENSSMNLPTLEEFGLPEVNDVVINSEVTGAETTPLNDQLPGATTTENPVTDVTETEVTTNTNDEETEENIVDNNDNTEIVDNKEGEEVAEPEFNLAVSESELSKKIDNLIAEAKKRKVSENNDLHFLKFLNKSQIDTYNGLSVDEQEQIKLYLNEKSYYSSNDVLRLISEALSVKNESLDEKLIRLMPENIKPIWSKLDENSMKSILSQARLYPDLNTEQKIEHFWNTRNLKKNESVNKKLVSHDSLIQEDRLSDGEINAIMERLKNL